MSFSEMRDDEIKARVEAERSEPAMTAKAVFLPFALVVVAFVAFSVIIGGTSTRVTELEENVRDLKARRDSPLEHDRELIVCPTCQGQGRLTSSIRGYDGSTVTVLTMSQEAVTCWGCYGKGWVTRGWERCHVHAFMGVQEVTSAAVLYGGGRR